MATMNVSLPDPMKDWVEAQTKDGRFSNASDYVRHLIRRDQERAEALAALQSAVDVGLASGPAQPFDLESLRKGWMERAIADAYDATEADPSRTRDLEDVFANLRAQHAKRTAQIE